MTTGSELAVGYVSLVPSAKGFEAAAAKAINGDKIGRDVGDQINDGINSKAESGGRKAGDLFGSGLGKAASLLGGVFLGGAAAKIGDELFTAASDLNESTNKAQVVFGDAFAKIDQQAQGAAKSMGISSQAALESASTFGNLFRAMGIGVDTSAEMSSRLIALASDLASFNNADPSDVLEALRSGLTGEIEPLRRFGVNITDVRVKAEALRLGLVKASVSQVDVADKTNKLNKLQAAQNEILKKAGPASQDYKDAVIATRQAEQQLNDELAGKVPELTAAQKAQAIYNVILQDTTLAQGDFARTADGAANKQRILAAVAEDTKARLGQALLPIGTTIMDQAVNGLNAVNDWWTANGPTVQAWFTNTFGTDPSANFGRGIDIIKAKLQEVVDWWTTNVGTFDDLKNGLNTIDSALGGNTVKLNEQSGPLDALTGAWTIFDQTVGPSGVGGRLVWLKDSVLDPLWGSLQTGSGIFVDTYNFLHDVFGPAIDQNLITPMQDAWNVIQWGKDHVLDPLIGTLQKIADFLNGITSNPIGSIHDIGHQLGIPGFDEGGVVPGPVGAPRIILAHAGETILPTHKGAVSVGGRTPHAGARAVTVNLTVAEGFQTTRATQRASRAAALAMPGL